MKVYVLMENTACSPEFTAEHGLSLYIETGSHKILFDSGQSGRFTENAEKLGVDLASVDTFILSHGHYDHGGGIKRFLDINSRAKIYMNKDAFMPHYNGTEKYIGLDESIKDCGRIVFCGEEEKIDEDLFIYAANDMKKLVPTDPFGLNMIEDGIMKPDDFRHEHYLLIKDGGRDILISGCSHKGIINIENKFRPDILLGGFHLSKLNPENEDERKRLEDTAKKLLSYKTVYYTGHCTGTAQYDYLKSIMKDRLFYLSTGKIFNI